MPVADVKKVQAREKRRICRQLKKLGITKKELAEKSGFHYQTVKWALDHRHPGWSKDFIAAANKIINPVESEEHDTSAAGTT